MKIKLYITHYRSRHGDDGICVFYTEKERFMDLLDHVLPVDDLGHEDLQLRNEAIETINEGDADSAYGVLLDITGSSDVEYTTETPVIDTDQAEVVL